MRRAGCTTSVPCPNGPAKAAGVVAGMLAEADSVDDLYLLGSGVEGLAFVDIDT